MEQQGGNKGIWAGFFIALLAAALFLTLWYFRGTELDSLNGRLAAAQSEGASEKRRLESELREARGSLDFANRKTDELEQRVLDEQRRAGEAAQQIERRLRLDLDAAEERFGALNRELEELRASDLKSRTEAEGLRTRLDAAVRTRDESETLRKQADDLRRQLRSSKERFAESNDAVRSLELRLGESEAALAAARKELDASRSDLNQALSAKADVDESRRNGEIARLETALAGAENANAALEELRIRLSRELEEERKKAAQREEEFVKRQADLQRTIDELRGRAAEGSAAAPAADAGAEAAKRLAEREAELRRGFAEETAELRRRIGELETGKGNGADAEEPGLRERLTGENARLRTEAGKLAKEAADLRTLAAGLGGQRDALRERVGELERRLEAAAAREKELESRLSGENAELRRRLGILERDRTEFVERAKAVVERLTREKGDLQARIGELEREKAAVLPPPTPFAADAGGAGRSVGRVVETMSDGRTFLIDVGSEQRVGPGMRFLVHRPDGPLWRYAGVLKVIRALENHAMAVVETLPDVKICPATGRAVLDPAAVVSPYAPGVELAAADAGSAVGPAIGDYLDNVFYDPGRSLLFALGPDLAGSESATLLVRLLGGVPCLNTGDPGRADFMVFGSAVPAGQPERPTPATLPHMFRYWNSK